MRWCGDAVIGDMVIWWYGDMVIWWYGDTVIWWYGDMVIRWYGDMVIRWYGDMVTRWYGDMVIRWCGDAVIRWYTLRDRRTYRQNITSSCSLATITTLCSANYRSFNGSCSSICISRNAANRILTALRDTQQHTQPNVQRPRYALQFIQERNFEEKLALRTELKYFFSVRKFEDVKSTTRLGGPG